RKLERKHENQSEADHGRKDSNGRWQRSRSDGPVFFVGMIGVLFAVDDIVDQINTGGQKSEYTHGIRHRPQIRWPRGRFKKQKTREKKRRVQSKVFYPLSGADRLE